mgnify:CR=1 FL=1
MLENPKLLREMVNKTGAKGTNAEAEETVEHLCSKCDHYAEEWGPVADRIWAEQKHKKAPYENYTEEKRESSGFTRQFIQSHAYITIPGIIRFLCQDNLTFILPVDCQCICAIQVAIDTFII